MARIRIDQDLWQSITADEQEMIIAKLQKVGALKPEDQIVHGPNITAEDGPCELACTATYEAACAECASLGGGAPGAVCYAAATAAYGVCLAACKVSG